ncbi:MAG: thioesterase family protein [Chitinophagales bacterium]|nr:thioesterase family protein [Chitinophagales bacterium]
MTDHLSHFHFKFPLQMRWNDLDALGHVNNAIFVTYFEVARGMYMPTACKNWDWTKDMFLIGNIQADFHKELLLTAQQAEVWMRTAKMGTKSFVLEYAIVSQKNGEKCTTCHRQHYTNNVRYENPKHYRNSILG